MVIGGKNYTNFQNIRVRGTGGSAAEYRVVDAAGTEGTISIGTLEGARAWTLPTKSGILTTTGTFSVDFPSIAATTYTHSTVVTVSGITAVDALTVTPNATFAASATARILIGAVPGAGQITLYFANIGSAANGLYAQTFTFTAAR